MYSDSFNSMPNDALNLNGNNEEIPETETTIETDNKRQRYKLTPKHYVMLCLAVIVIVIIGVLVGKNSKSLNGRYVSLRNSWTYELKQTDKNSGTFELYDADGEIYKSNKRKTWSREDNLLILRLGDDENYFLIVDDGLIEIDDDDEEPECAGYIAPRGKFFDYEIGNYEFSADGTYSISDYSGKYYVEKNVIYCKQNSYRYSYTYGDTSYTSPWVDFEYEPVFWIYDKNRITYAHNVYLKD